MGMFFWVKKEDGEECPYCETTLTENYQSKDSKGNAHDVWGGCCNKHTSSLPLLEKSEVENFYQICPNPECKRWIEYKVNEPFTLVPDDADV